MLPIKLTKIEQQMAGMLVSVASNMGFDPGMIRMQFPFENPTGGKPYTMDFAIPPLKIDVEADGEVWHSSSEQVGDDQERDYMLAQRGWTVLRFDDQAIEESPQVVQQTINTYITKAMEASGKKVASKQEPHYFVRSANNGSVKDLGSRSDVYYTYLDNTYPSRAQQYEVEIDP